VFVSTATDIVLDNTNPAVSFEGAWQTGNSAAGRYGPDYRFASTAAGGASNASYRPYIYAPGYYDVFVWYPQGSNRATNAPWSLSYQGGSVTIAVNQQINGGAWFRIGTALPFSRGTNGSVRLSNDTGYSGVVVLADAVRFLLVSPFAPPAILSARVDPPAFNLTFSTEAGPVYTVEFKNALDDSQWQTLTNAAGTGAPLAVLDAPLTNPMRFYRVRVQ